MPKIGIGRDDHPRFRGGELEDLFVFRLRHAAIAHVDGVMPGRAQPLRDVGDTALSMRNFMGSRRVATLALEPLQPQIEALL